LDRVVLVHHIGLTVIGLGIQTHTQQITQGVVYLITLPHTVEVKKVQILALSLDLILRLSQLVEAAVLRHSTTTQLEARQSVDRTLGRAVRVEPQDLSLLSTLMGRKQVETLESQMMSAMVEQAY
jgi:hypothetical protein